MNFVHFFPLQKGQHPYLHLCLLICAPALSSSVAEMIFGISTSSHTVICSQRSTFPPLFLSNFIIINYLQFLRCCLVEVVDFLIHIGLNTKLFLSKKRRLWKTGKVNETCGSSSNNLFTICSVIDVQQ